MTHLRPSTQLAGTGRLVKFSHPALGGFEPE
jgi:hypothetical protein